MQAVTAPIWTLISHSCWDYKHFSKDFMLNIQNIFVTLIIIKTFVRFLMAHTTHTCIYGGDTGHTHTHADRPEVVVNLFSAFSHPGPSFLKDPPGAMGSFAAPGDQVK